MKPGYIYYPLNPVVKLLKRESSALHLIYMAFIIQIKHISLLRLTLYVHISTFIISYY